jgi:hypothetical protein
MSNHAMRPGPTSGFGDAAWSGVVARVRATVTARIVFRIDVLLTVVVR